MVVLGHMCFGEIVSFRNIVTLKATFLQSALDQYPQAIEKSRKAPVESLSKIVKRLFKNYIFLQSL